MMVFLLWGFCIINHKINVYAKISNKVKNFALVGEAFYSTKTKALACEGTNNSIWKLFLLESTVRLDLIV